jgi:Zn-dependent protease with chaperone function
VRLLITAIENFVLFGTLLALAGFAAAWVVRAMAARTSREIRPERLARVYTLALFAPPVAAARLVAGALLPETWLGEAAFDAAHPAPLHELHLLSDLTVALEPALAYATILFVIAAALFAAWSSLRGYVRIGRVIRRLEMNAAQPAAGQVALVERIAGSHSLHVGLVMSDYPLSFVWGFKRSRLVLSSGLLNALSPEELAGVLEHEAAHHARRDNLFKLALTMCSYASLAFPLSRLIFKWRSTEVEMICDEVAVARTSSPLDVASALVKLRRQTLVPSPYASNGAAVSSSFAPDDVPSFERRVRRVIGFADSMPDPVHAARLSQTRKGAAFVTASLMAVTLFALPLFAPLALHTAAESVIHIIK